MQATTGSEETKLAGPSVGVRRRNSSDALGFGARRVYRLRGCRKGGGRRSLFNIIIKGTTHLGGTGKTGGSGGSAGPALVWFRYSILYYLSCMHPQIQLSPTLFSIFGGSRS